MVEPQMRLRSPVTCERCACPAKYERFSHRRDRPISNSERLPISVNCLGVPQQIPVLPVRNRVEPVASFEPLVHLLYRALGKRCDIEVLADARGHNGSCENCAAAQNTPSQKHGRGRLSTTTGERDNERVVEQSRFQRVPQRSERQQDDALRLAVRWVAG